MKKFNFEKVIEQIAPYLIVGGLAYVFLPKFFSSLNPFATPSDVANAATSDLWSGKYGAGKPYHGLTAQAARDKAEFIYNAYGAFTNDFSGIISVFKSLLYKTQLTDLINEFRSLYGLDLYTYITGGLKNASLASKQMQSVVIAYANSLPSGIV